MTAFASVVSRNPPSDRFPFRRGDRVSGRAAGCEFLARWASTSSYKGIEITATKRISHRWQMLAGYTYSVTEQTDLSVATTPNAFLNTQGRVYSPRSGSDRRTWGGGARS